MKKVDTTAELSKRLVELEPEIEWAETGTVLKAPTPEEAAKRVAKALIEAHEELRRANAEMALIIQSHFEHAILSLDAYGTVIAISAQGADLLGWPMDEILGKPINVFLSNRKESIESTSAEMASADTGEPVSSEHEHRREDGTSFEARHVLHALIGKGGQLTGFIRNIENLTRRRAHELHIEELEARIALLVR